MAEKTKSEGKAPEPKGPVTFRDKHYTNRKLMIGGDELEVVNGKVTADNPDVIKLLKEDEYGFEAC